MGEWARKMTMNEMGNPFWDTTGDLLVLDTRVVAEVGVVESVSRMKKLWKIPTTS